jgi:muconolactone delta-isomerase
MIVQLDRQTDVDQTQRWGHFMNTGTLRQLWTVIEETQTHKLQRLNDADLVKQLLSQLHTKQPLSTEETRAMRGYLNAKLPLIRDIVQV